MHKFSFRVKKRCHYDVKMCVHTLNYPFFNEFFSFTPTTNHPKSVEWRLYLMNVNAYASLSNFMAWYSWCRPIIPLVYTHFKLSMRLSPVFVFFKNWVWFMKKSAIKNRFMFFIICSFLFLVSFSIFLSVMISFKNKKENRCIFKKIILKWNML